MASPFDSQYSSIRDRITYYANQYGVDPNIGIWQLWQENKFRSTGCSGASACGIAQFIPATAARFGVDRNNVESSLNGWAKYMRWLLDRSYIHGDYRLALAGYNAGEGNVQKYGGIPPFTETRNYVNYIMSNAGSPGTPSVPATTNYWDPATGVYYAGDLATVTVSASESDISTYAMYALGALLFVLLID